MADKAGPGPAVLEMVITSQRQVGGSTASGEVRCSSCLYLSVQHLTIVKL